MNPRHADFQAFREGSKGLYINHLQRLADPPPRHTTAQSWHIQSELVTSRVHHHDYCPLQRSLRDGASARNVRKMARRIPLPFREVCQRVGLKASLVYRLIALGQFPRQVKLSERTVARALSLPRADRRAVMFE